MPSSSFSKCGVVSTKMIRRPGHWEQSNNDCVLPYSVTLSTPLFSEGKKMEGDNCLSLD